MTDIKTIHVYDTNDGMKHVRDIPLTGIDTIHRIQGGEFYNGTLYLSNDTMEEVVEFAKKNDVFAIFGLFLL